MNIKTKTRFGQANALVWVVLLFFALSQGFAASVTNQVGTNVPPGSTAKAQVSALPQAELIEVGISDGGVIFATYKKERVGFAEIKSQGGIWSRDNVKFSATGGGFLNLRAMAGQAHFAARGLKGVTWVVSGGNEIGCSYRKDGAGMDFLTPANNRDDVEVDLPDGGKVQLPPGATLRIDLFANGCYVLTGTGRVVAENGDGHRSLLTVNSLPMTGGPQYQKKDRLGVERLERLSPLVALTIGGMENQSLRLTLGDQEFLLPPTAARDITMTNGLVVRFSQDPESGGFTWKVVKGEMTIAVQGILKWKAYGLSGCGGVMHWDRKTMSLDFRNTSAENVNISLPSRTIAVVEPGSSFEYAVAQGGIENGPTTSKGVKENSYATAAVGNVHIYNALNHRSYDVVSKNQLFIGGVPSNEQNNVSESRINVQTTWDNGLPFAFKMGNMTNGVMKPGDRKDVKYDKFHEIEFIYGEGGMMTVVAVEGSYHLILQNANGMVMDVEEGNKATMTLDLKKKTFVLQTGVDNASYVGMQTDAGSALTVEKDRIINFNISDNGTVVGQSSDSSGGGIVFFQNGGANPNSGQNPGSPGFGIGGNPGTLNDPTLLNQPTVTP